MVSSNVTATLCSVSGDSVECKEVAVPCLPASPCSHSIKALSIPNVISSSACYCAAAVVYTGLRKEPCEPGGNCVKSPCELSVRWLADRWVCRLAARKGREGGGRRGRRIEKKGGGRRRDTALKASKAGSWLAQPAREDGLSS